MSRTAPRRWDRCLLGASLLALSGCTAILDFSEPIDKTDAGAEDATPTGPDASPAACLTFEPNGTVAESTTITAMDVVSAVCGASDSDFFSFAVSANEDVSITLSFTGQDGDDLDLQLLDDASDVIVDSTGSSNTEQINRTDALGTQLAAGTYHLEVKPVTVSSLIDYTINLSITPVTTP